MNADVFRYLGIKGEPDDQTRAAAERHMAWLETNVPGASVFRVFPRETLPESADLARHVGESREIILFAATLGTAVDARLRSIEVVSMSDAVIFDACASDYIERVCDRACAEIAENFPRMTRRFSPGYGDLSLEFQPKLCDLLQTQKRIGLTVTPGNTLLPFKSVTAIMGTVGARLRSAACHNACGSCPNRETCQYKRV